MNEWAGKWPGGPLNRCSSQAVRTWRNRPAEGTSLPSSPYDDLGRKRKWTPSVRGKIKRKSGSHPGAGSKTSGGAPDWLKQARGAAAAWGRDPEIWHELFFGYWIFQATMPYNIGASIG